MTKGAIIEIEPFSYSMGISANLQFYHYDIIINLVKEDKIKDE